MPPHPTLSTSSVAHRPSSTPQMEGLARESASVRLPAMSSHALADTPPPSDLASQQTPIRPPRTHSSDSIPRTEPARNVQQRSVASFNPLYQTVDQTPPKSRTGSGASIQDFQNTMIGKPPEQPPPPRSFPASNALTDVEAQTVTNLLNYLGDNSYDYDSHVQLITLLHKGFVAHTYPPADSLEATPRNPHDYAQLEELRQSRKAMDSRFAVGEALWLEWLADESLLAQSAEESISVTELYQKAVGDETASVKLWQAYADWIEGVYRACHDMEHGDSATWTSEDKEMLRELFTRDMLLSVLQEGVEKTRWRIDESHLLWNRWMQMQLEDLPAQPDQSEVERIRDACLERLKIPHATSLQTAQELLWPFINRYYPEDWEIIMERGKEKAEPCQRQMALREEHELHVQRAAVTGDRQALFGALSAYLVYEKKRRKKDFLTYELSCGLYERALLAFPTYAEWWLDYIDLVVIAERNIPTVSVLALIERATCHCPWSGDLWAQRILRLDVEGRPHSEIEQTKHRATSSGLLDIVGLDEPLKVLQQWCTYLRRHAFSSSATEDDPDIAEVGIQSALENVMETGRKLYGKDFQGDPLYRLETILIKFFTQSRRVEDARRIWERLSRSHSHDSEFWFKWYAWEVWLWGYERLSEKHRVETKENAPYQARAVASNAMSQNITHLDSPEKVVEMFLMHFQQHEQADQLQSALIEAREYSKRIAIRRGKEAEAAAAQAAKAAAERGQQDLVSETEAQAADVSVGESGEKRKADDAALLSNGTARSKKVKTGEPAASATQHTEPSSSATAQIKRDREHNSINLHNLPSDVEELEIKKFFREIGRPVATNIVQDKTAGTAIATVEFETQEDVLAAKTRNGKEIRPSCEVRIHSGSQNTLYVSNYPPEYDEQAIKRLFDSYGEIISVRFPSLKFNNRRRFCYVQFLTEDMARKAEETMDSKTLDRQHRLIARISNPEAAKQRSGARAEGREIFVKNVERDASDEAVEEFFAQFGRVVSMNLLKLVNNRKTGSGFVVYSSADEANKALEADGKPFRDRILQVAISGAKTDNRATAHDRARKTDILVKQATPDAVDGSRRGSDISMASATASADQHQQQPDHFRTARERKIAILNLPDTVNDARILAAMETYGQVVKIQLRREQEGAIVEFQTLRDAFNVRQGVDVSTLGPEAKTGDVEELLAKKRQGGAGAGGAGMGMGGLRPAVVSRPGQNRGGRRGGLGFKRAAGAAKEEKSGGASGSGSGGGSGAGAGAGKSNSDFRAMLEARPSAGSDGDNDGKAE